MDAVVHVPDPAAGSFRGADNLRFEVPCDVNGGGVVAVPAVDGETEVGAHRAQEVAEEGHNQVLPYHESRCRGKRKLSAPLTRSTSA